MRIEPLMAKPVFTSFAATIVPKPGSEVGWQVRPRYRAVEQTYGWMIRWKQLVSLHERHLNVSEPMIDVAMGALLLRCVPHRSCPSNH